MTPSLHPVTISPITFAFPILTILDKHSTFATAERNATSCETDALRLLLSKLGRVHVGTEGGGSAGDATGVEVVKGAEREQHWNTEVMGGWLSWL